MYTHESEQWEREDKQSKHKSKSIETASEKKDAQCQQKPKETKSNQNQKLAVSTFFLSLILHRNDSPK